MIQWLKRLFTKGAAPAAVRADTTTGFGFIDAYKRHRNPTPRELLEEWKNTAWVCASINAIRDRMRITKAFQIDEVTDHPLLTLI